MDLKLSVVCIKSNTVENFIVATTAENFAEITSFVSVSRLVHKIIGGLDIMFEDTFKNLISSIP